jgi:hypothetical protein
MAPEPRRKDGTRDREKPAGLEPAEETAPPPEEYTSYREVDPGNESPAEEEAVREADLQPGSPRGDQAGRERGPGKR